MTTTSFTNYWDQNSGDSMASPWGQYSTKFGSKAAQLAGTPTAPTAPTELAEYYDGGSIGFYEDPNNPMQYAGGSRTFNEGPVRPNENYTPWTGDPTTGMVAGGGLGPLKGYSDNENMSPATWGGDTNWMQELSKNQQSTPSTNPWTQARMNNDTMQGDTRYGPASSVGANGEGYWSGGRPGTGSWIEGISGPQAPLPVTPATPAPQPAMVPGAQAQTPARTPAVADDPVTYEHQEEANFDSDLYFQNNPDVAAWAQLPEVQREYGNRAAWNHYARHGVHENRVYPMLAALAQKSRVGGGGTYRGARYSGYHGYDFNNSY